MFIRHLFVRPSILVKKHAKVHNFLLDTKKAAGTYVILDLPGEEHIQNEILIFNVNTEELMGLFEAHRPD